VIFAVGVVGGADGEVVAGRHYHVMSAGDLRGLRGEVMPGRLS
jgi:hypothetical protein